MDKLREETCEDAPDVEETVISDSHYQSDAKVSNTNNLDHKVREKCESAVKDCEQGDKPATETCDDADGDDSKSKKPVVFKKPLLIVGPRRGKPGGKVKSLQSTARNTVEVTTNDNIVGTIEESIERKDSSSEQDASVKPKSVTDFSNPAQKLKEASVPLPYKEPSWSGIPDSSYSFEVLKDGKIIETIDLISKPYFVIGRLSVCDVHLAHPTISRYHAVMQYRKEGNELNSAGFYIYDLGSTHGTFLNKYRIRSNIHVRIQVGHMLKFGNSTRMFILQGPESDQEQESELTVTELKEKRRLEEEKREQEERLRELEEQKRKEQEEEEGIDWGMGEDADEETDLPENPFAATQNEELYIDDPKKTLLGWFEREGYELEYNVQEKGFAQYLCAVELPIGNGVVAEACVKGKKKEAVIQCALEACRILDRAGMLRQATHESRKRKAKNWEEDDFYDSDEDTFLDRTGSVEKKRYQRMQAAGKVKTEADTYESLVKKYNDVHDQIKETEKQYKAAVKKLTLNNSNLNENDEDALDAYMTQISSGIVDKKEISNLKSQLQVLHTEEDHLRKLVNIAKPASLPDLVPMEQLKPQISNKAALVAAVKRKVKADQMSKLPSETKPNLVDTGQVEEEEDEEDDDGDRSQAEKGQKSSNETDIVKEVNKEAVSVLCSEAQKSKSTGTGGVTSHPKIIGPSLPPCLNLSDLKGPPSTDLSDLKDEPPKKKRSRPKRSKDKKEKANYKSYDYDESDPDYSVWVPPENQSGDGRTKLNEKYGY